MKNANYNLAKLLLQKLDDVWRMEKHYAKDAEVQACAKCQTLLERILDDEKAHVEALRQEIATHIKSKKFD